MDRHMRAAILSRARYDWETHQATRQRNAKQIALLPTPEFPATGTARISALLAEARRRQDEALRQGVGDGAGGFRTGRPLDNLIEPADRDRVGRQPVAPPPPARTSADLAPSTHRS